MIDRIAGEWNTWQIQFDRISRGKTNLIDSRWMCKLIRINIALRGARIKRGNKQISVDAFHSREPLAAFALLF